MKFLTLLALTLASVTSVQAQSLGEYDQSFRDSHRTGSILYGVADLVALGLIFTFSPNVRTGGVKLALPSSPTILEKFWGKALPAESEKLNAARAEQKRLLQELKQKGAAATAEEVQYAKVMYKEELKKIEAEFKVAQAAKLKELGFMTKKGILGIKIYGWVRAGAMVYLVLDGVGRLAAILTDKPSVNGDDSQLESVRPEQLQHFLP
jgi:hypothetical protein